MEVQCNLHYNLEISNGKKPEQIMKMNPKSLAQSVRKSTTLLVPIARRIQRLESSTMFSKKYTT